MQPNQQSPNIPQPDPSYFMQPSEPPIDPATKRQKTIIKVAVSLMVVIGILAIGAIIFSRSGQQQSTTNSAPKPIDPKAQAVTDKFFTLLAQNDRNTAHNLYSPAHKPSQGDFTQFVTSFSALVHFDQCKLTNSAASTATSLLYVCPARNAANPDVKFIVTLVQSDGEYKIASCQLVGSS
jgi:hypothetical protein